jgi:hypothetical protein
MIVAGYQTLFLRLMWIKFSVVSKADGELSYLGCRPAQIMCSSFALSNISGCLVWCWGIGNKCCRPRSFNVFTANAARTLNSLSSRL